jgi:hypothetical protein
MIPLGRKVYFGKSEEFGELLRFPTVRKAHEWISGILRTSFSA